MKHCIAILTYLISLTLPINIIDPLKVIEKDKASGSTATGLLRKINNYEFLGTLCLLKNMLPILLCLSKHFQTGSLNFSRITPSINICKEKWPKWESFEATEGYLEWEESAINLNETAEARIQGFVHKCNTPPQFV